MRSSEVTGEIVSNESKSSNTLQKPKLVSYDKSKSSATASSKTKTNNAKGKLRRSQSLPSPDKDTEKQLRNTLVTDYFPVRRSSRMPASLKQREKQQEVIEAIKNGSEEGLKVVIIEGKGRGVVATRALKRGDYVVEYAGDLLLEDEAGEREAQYELTPNVGCYMYYFLHAGKRYCVDATAETPRLGRLINHSKTQPNCATRVVAIGDTPHLILVAARDIGSGEELLYDYGDRSRNSIASHPWLAY